jgi:hypothetical protein
MLSLAVFALIIIVWGRDFHRRLDINEQLRSHFVHSHHFYELIAIPVLVFSAFAAMFLLIPLGLLIRSAFPDFMPILQALVGAIKHLPWMGLTVF